MPAPASQFRRQPVADDNRAQIGGAVDVPQRGNRDAPGAVAATDPLHVAAEVGRNLLHRELRQPALLPEVA